MNLILKAQTSSFLLTDVGVIIADSQGSDFSDSAGVGPEIRKALGQSAPLRVLVTAGDVVVNDGSSDLSAANGLLYLNKQWFQAGQDSLIDLSQVSGIITDTQHGDRGGGSLHPAATTGVNGFMSAADKAKMDNLVGLSPSVVTGTGELTTSATTYTALSTPMSVTPGAGTYLCRFSTSMGNSKNANQTLVSLFGNGVQVTESQRRMIGQAGNYGGVCCEALITVADGQAIDVRWMVDSGSVGSMQNRTLVVQRLV